jgi:hypothetical protein
MDAGSDVVATTSTTIFSSSDSNTPAAPRAPHLDLGEHSPKKKKKTVAAARR